LKEHSYPTALLDNRLEDNGKYWMHDNIILEHKTSHTGVENHEYQYTL